MRLALLPLLLAALAACGQIGEEPSDSLGATDEICDDEIDNDEDDAVDCDDEDCAADDLCV